MFCPPGFSEESDEHSKNRAIKGINYFRGSRELIKIIDSAF